MNHIIFGLRAVIEALQSGREIDKILIKKDRQGSELLRELTDLLRGRLIPVQRVPIERLNRITRKNHQGVIAFASAVAYQRLEDIIPFIYEQGRDPLLMLLDGVTDVRNFGAIARTCECVGADALVIPSEVSASATPDAMKASAGALNVLPVCRERTLHGALRFLHDSGVRLIAATEKATTPYTAITYTGPLAIVMGAEDTGVAPAHLRLCDEWVRIPQRGTIASLNVSVAAGVLLYEALRQRGQESQRRIADE